MNTTAHDLVMCPFTAHGRRMNPGWGDLTTLAEAAARQARHEDSACAHAAHRVDEQHWYCITGHSRDKTRRIWRRIKARSPATAALLRDPGLQAIVEAFGPGCDVLIDTSALQGQEAGDVRDDR